MSKELAIVTPIATNEVITRFTNFLDVAPITVRAYKSGIKQFAKYLSFTGIKNPVRDDVMTFKKELQCIFQH